MPDSRPDIQRDPLCTTPTPTSTAVLLIAHGSRRPEANQDLIELAARLEASGAFPRVQAAFLELADPDIPTGFQRCVDWGANRVLMVPYFLSMGVHLGRDLATARDELSSSHPEVEILLGSALGPHRLLDDLVIERIKETSPRTRSNLLTDSAPG